MNIFSSPRFLTTVLWCDAAAGAATGALQLAAPGWLGETLGIAPGLLLATGAVLAGFVLFLSWLASRQPVPRMPLLLLIAGNWVWVAGCLALLLTGAAATALGQAYLVMQAVTVAVLAELEWMGLRRYPVTGWA